MDQPSCAPEREGRGERRGGERGRGGGMWRASHLWVFYCLAMTVSHSTCLEISLNLLRLVFVFTKKEVIKYVF